MTESIERVGFDSAWVYDHFHTAPEPTQEVTYEAWSLMAALAASTKSVRLGQMCTCNTYRPPSYLAKVAASIDIISGGRLEMGIGAGWYEHEHHGYGYPFLPARERLGMLREGIEILREMWTNEVVDYEGKYYNLKEAICQPKPMQDPHIPLWVAGGGEKVTLRIAAKYASYANFGIALEDFVHKSEVLRDHCQQEGTDYESVTRSSPFWILCGETETEVAEKKAWLRSHYRKYLTDDASEEATALCDTASGTPEQIVEHLRDWEEEGMTYAIVNFPDAAYDSSSFELFARHVITAFAT